ncbi:MAG TPA: DUF1217 domain-containing protein [Acetobacteraceae bacterium]
MIGWPIFNLDLSILNSSSASTAGTGGNPIVALQQAVKGQVRGIADTAKQPEVQRDIAAFRKAVTSAADPKALLANPVARRVLMTANGLGDQTAYAALATKALLSDPTNAKSLASTLTDTRWKSAATTLNFAKNGLTALRDPKVLDTMVNAYAEIAWRKSLDAQTPGLSDALAFRASAATAKNVDDVLGNATLRKVVTGALGIPQEIALQPLDTQERAISSKLDMKRLQDPKYVDQLAQRYLLAQADKASQTSQTSQTGQSLLI